MPKKKGKKQTDKTSGSTGEAEGADGKQANLSEEVLQDFWQGTTDEEAVKLGSQQVAEMKALVEHTPKYKKRPPRPASAPASSEQKQKCCGCYFRACKYAFVLGPPRT